MYSITNENESQDSSHGLLDSYFNPHRSFSMKESIVLNAWELITRYHSLKKLNFFPSFVGMLWLFCILIYQITYTYVIVFQKKDQLFGALSNFVHTEYFTEVIVSLVSIFVLYTLLEPIANGGIIQMIDSYRKSK